MKTNGKKKTCKNNLRAYPSEKTRWAYWMQAIEPTSQELNKAFPEYHPQWVQMSQQLTVGGSHFAFLRTQMGLTQEQCAAYLRTAVSTIQGWEKGRSPVPFTAFELLRVVQSSTQFKLSHPNWDGWFVGLQGELVSPDVGCSFTPGELNLLSFQKNDLSWMRGEIARLQKELKAANAANTQLRQMFLSQSMAEELISMKDRLNALVNFVAPAQVFPTQPTEKIIKELAA